MPPAPRERPDPATEPVVAPTPKRKRAAICLPSKRDIELIERYLGNCEWQRRCRAPAVPIPHARTRLELIRTAAIVAEKIRRAN